MLQNASAMAIIPVADLGRARTFYEKMLGLNPREALESEGEVIYSIGSSMLLVYQTEAARGDATKVAIMVEDLAKEMSDLKNHGVVFEDFDLPGLKTVNGVVDRPSGKAAWFRDPDGNYISLGQMT